MSDYNQNLETTCDSTLRFAEHKDLFIKRVKKTSQKWIMYVAYIAILEHQISAKDITSDYGFLLRSVKTFAVDTKEYQYPKCTKVNDAKTFKSLVVSFYTLFSQIICMHFAY